MSRRQLTPEVSCESDFYKNEADDGYCDAFLYVRPTKKDLVNYIDLRLSGESPPPEITFRHKGCGEKARVYDATDRPMTKIACDCSKWLLHEVEALTDAAIADKFEISVLASEKWPVKVDRLTSPSGLKYTGTRDCTEAEAAHYFLGPFYEARKRGFRKPPKQ